MIEMKDSTYILEPFDYRVEYEIDRGADPRPVLDIAVNEFMAWCAVMPPVKVWRVALHVISDLDFAAQLQIIGVRARGSFDIPCTYQGYGIYRQEVLRGQATPTRLLGLA